jgi:amino acid transporter
VVWVVFFALLFTLLNLRGIETSAVINRWLAIAMSCVVVYMLICMGRYLAGIGPSGPDFFTKPFYNPETFSVSAVFTGTSIAALTYIGIQLCGRTRRRPLSISSCKWDAAGCNHRVGYGLATGRRPFTVWHGPR